MSATIIPFPGLAERTNRQADAEDDPLVPKRRREWIFDVSIYYDADEPTGDLGEFQGDITAFANGPENEDVATRTLMMGQALIEIGEEMVIDAERLGRWPAEPE